MTSLNKICLHWTAGTNKPCITDLQAYHFLFDGEGKEYSGKYKPEDNINCYDGCYAKHCGGGNTGCIGLSCCGMRDFDFKNKKTKYPLTQIQVEKMCYKAAQLCNKYGILITPQNVFTHYEFDSKKANSKGKTDIAYLPYLPNLEKEKVGEYLRNKIKWYQVKQKKGN